MSDVVRFIPRVRLLVLDSIPGKSVTPSDWDVHGVFIKHRVVKESVCRVGCLKIYILRLEKYNGVVSLPYQSKRKKRSAGVHGSFHVGFIHFYF